MRLLRSLAIVAVLTTASAQGSNAETPEGAAEAAARVWLGLVDAGDYAKSWVTGAEYFRNLVLQAQWVTSVAQVDRKSTRLNSSHSQISYAVFCLKKKNSIEGSATGS